MRRRGNFPARRSGAGKIANRVLGVAIFLALSSPSELRADRMVLKNGQKLQVTILRENDSLVRYLDRYERPRRIAAREVDSMIYDLNGVKGKVKVAFRKGQPSDRSGFVRLRHSEELDLEVEYRVDSASELDLFFKNRVQVRIMPRTSFRVLKAPKGLEDPVVIDLAEGEALVAGHGSKALARLATPGGIAVGRGLALFGVKAGSGDSSLMVLCLKGLVGIQEKAHSPGELAVEPMKALAYARAEGMFQPMDPDSTQVEALRRNSENLLRYRLEHLEKPPIGYFPKAIVGLGFMVFFYGSALGILSYANSI